MATPSAPPSLKNLTNRKKCESKIRSSKEPGERKHKHVKRSVATAEAQITKQMTAEQCPVTVPPAMSTTSMGLTPRDNFQKVTAALTRYIRQANIQNAQFTRGALLQSISQYSHLQDNFIMKAARGSLTLR